MAKTLNAVVDRARKATGKIVQEKFATMRREMSASLIERDEEIDVVLTALICREHPLFVGPPGTAKSLLLDTLMRWFGSDTSRFAVLFTKFTTPEEVFGPVSVAGLKSDVYRRITTNKLPEADVAFADEIFKASSAILNTMLRILNERVYENGDGTFRKCPLRICVAASNEWPADQDGGKELGALFDRFLFRKAVRTVTKSGRTRLLWERDHEPKLSTSISPGELDLAHQEAKSLEWTDDAKDALEEILDALNAEGIFPGDRRQYKSILAAQAYAFLRGASQVEREHLEILAHVLWDDPTEQPEKCGKIVAKIANPTGAIITEKLLQIQDIVAKNKATEAVSKLQEVQKDLEALPNHERKSWALAFVSKEIKREYDKVIGRVK